MLAVRINFITFPSRKLIREISGVDWDLVDGSSALTGHFWGACTSLA